MVLLKSFAEKQSCSLRRCGRRAGRSLSCYNRPMHKFDLYNEKENLAQIVNWADRQPAIRAAILTSTRAIPGGVYDIFSDYDLILVVPDVMPFHNNRDWQEEAFGPILVQYHDPLGEQMGYPSTTYVTQFESGLKIDFTVWQVELVQKLAKEGILPEEMDAGYLVILDKDHLTDQLKPPSYQAYIPKPPSAERYHAAVEDFFLVATYAAKYLWRGDIIAVKYLMSTFLRHEDLLPLLEWHGEIARGWTVKPGLYGRRLHHWLRSDLYAAFESTYTGAGTQETWDALYRAMDLMHAAGVEVGEQLSFPYPHEIEAKTRAYIDKIRATPKLPAQAEGK